MTTVAEAIVAHLKESGVRRVFGLPSDSLNGFTDVLRKDSGGPRRAGWLSAGPWTPCTGAPGADTSGEGFEFQGFRARPRVIDHQRPPSALISPYSILVFGL